ncbi:MAG TPA: type II secretion system protein [Telluria sp.]
MCTKVRQRGVTLVELLVFIMIVSIAVGGILGVMSLATGKSADPLRRKQALMIAESLMEEVQMADFTFCDPTSPDADTATSTADCDIPENWGRSAAEPGHGRPYDNINDYVPAAGTATPAFDVGGSLADASGDPFDVSGYTATVSVTPAALGICPSPPGGACVGGPGTGADAEALLITVTVSYDGDSIVLDGYRTRYAPR